MNSLINKFASIDINIENTFLNNLENSIKGFHKVNDMEITGTLWEYIFVEAYKKFSDNIKYDPGSHKSGKDCKINNISYSNKTANIKNNKINISSYRLTKCKSVDDFIKEIDIVRKNFDIYALLVKDVEKNKKIINYSYYELPCDFFTASKFIWEKNKESGWKTNILNGVYLSVTFSMSNQLWIHVNVDEIEKFLRKKISVSTEKVMSYAHINNLL